MTTTANMERLRTKPFRVSSRKSRDHHIQQQIRRPLNSGSQQHIWRGHTHDTQNKENGHDTQNKEKRQPTTELTAAQLWRRPEEHTPPPPARLTPLEHQQEQKSICHWPPKQKNIEQPDPDHHREMCWYNLLKPLAHR